MCLYDNSEVKLVVSRMIFNGFGSSVILPSLEYIALRFSM